MLELYHIFPNPSKRLAKLDWPFEDANGFDHRICVSMIKMSLPFILFCKTFFDNEWNSTKSK